MTWPVTHYDLCLTWNWEYDADVVAMLEAACLGRQRSVLQVTPHNLAAVCQSLELGELSFATLFDRASDEHSAFLPIVEWAVQHRLRCINHRDRAQSAWDKATMHTEFLQAGIRTPRTLILPAFSAQPELPSLDTAALGCCFVVKPACRGGGLGVVQDAQSPGDVDAARRLYPDDRYLLQRCVAPAALGAQPAWFRVICCLGHVYLCWWDPVTHVYAPVTPAEESRFGLSRLRAMARSIAHACGLELFSTEIALTAQGELMAVDYVNDPLDLRLQSRAAEGVPDGIVGSIAGRLAAWL
jgi:hypothetical protein